MRITSVIVSVIAFALSSTEARKSYLIKDMINSGQLKVTSPRVQAATANWCLFKDTNNQFCLQATMNVKWEMKPTTIYQQAVVNAVGPNFLIQYDFKTIQSMNLQTNFVLQKLMSNQVAFDFPVFDFGWRYQLYYWLDDYAYCLNFGRFAGPTVAYTVQVTNQLEYCTKTIINCLDDWDLFLKDAQKFTGECQLSSSSPFTLYTNTFYDSGNSGAPSNTIGTHYYFGSDSYIANYCWPGFSPWYSYYDRYKNELIHGFYISFNDILGLFTALRAGVYHMHGKTIPDDIDGAPIVRDWDKIYKQSQDQWHQAQTTYAKERRETI